MRLLVEPLAAARGITVKSLPVAAIMAAILVSGRGTAGEPENQFPNPGFDEFSGDLPAGWSVDSWNQPATKVGIGRLAPGRGGTGTCLEIEPGTPMSVTTLRSQVFPVAADRDYLFKGYYASTSRGITTKDHWTDADGVSLGGHWLDDGEEKVGSFGIVLPDTQDRWIEFFQQVRPPEGARALQVVVTRRWVGGRLRLDDFSLRPGTIRDYEEEFSISEVEDEDFFPIFGWLTPGSPAPQYEGMDTDQYHAEYAVANFNINLELDEYAGFGVKYRPLGEIDDARMAAADSDPRVWWLGGASEPGEEEFPRLARMNERVRRLAPSKGYWVNLFPTYADDFHGDPEEYDHHVRTFLKTVKPSLFTYDHYCMVGRDPRLHADSWYSPNRKGDYFSNLEIVRRRSLETDAEFGVIVSVGSFGPVRGASEAELRFQAFTILAYGARSLGWFTYLTEIPYGHWTNWEDMVINRDGTRTRHYSMLKYLNGEVLALAPALLRLESTGVYHTEPLPPLTRPLGESELVASISGGMGLVGEFRSAGDGLNYMMVVNRDFIDPATFLVRLREPADDLREISKQTGRPQPVAGHAAATGELTLALGGGDGRLFRLGASSR